MGSDEGEDESPVERPLPTAAVPRRTFLGKVTICLGACAGLGVVGTVGAAVVGTPLSDEGADDAGWYDLGLLERFRDGEPVKVSVMGERVDAWNRFPAQSLGRVLVLRTGEALAILSAVCPHNGCDVFVGEGEFTCPCHDSTFKLDGELIGGKSPRGLDPLEAEVKDGRVRVRLQRFEVGTAERKPV